MVLYEWLAPLLAVVALVFAAWLAWRVLQEDTGNDTMRDISASIAEGSAAFLRREYTWLAIFGIAVTVILGAVVSIPTSLAYLTGAVCSGLTGIIGMNMAVRANVRTAAAASVSLNRGLTVAFRSGAVMGLAVVGVGLLGVSLWYLITRDVSVLPGFGFGASSIALFARVGGGIYTKAADVGADLVGKVEQGIPEDDARNPAVIADNVGDNVGDVAGMGADLFESYVGSIIAAASLAAIIGSSANYVLLPFGVAAMGIIASIIGTFFVRSGEKPDPSVLLGALRRGIYVASILSAVLAFGLVQLLGLPLTVFWPIIVGLVAGIIIGYATEYFTSAAYRPTKSIAEAAATGPAMVIISGFAIGMRSTTIPMLVIVLATLAAYFLADVYGVAIAAVGMLSTLGITLATDAYGPVADNAGGIAEQAHLEPFVRERTDALDSLGNTTAATGKGFAIGSAVLTALALMAAYIQATGVAVEDFSLANPVVLAGLIIGAGLPYIFSAMSMTAVGEAAFGIVNEVRRQFREIPGIMEGTGRPDYARCVDISTKEALRQMIGPGVLAVAAPLVVGFVLGPAALGGLLVGATASGFLLALTMATAGGAWDNAKKFIESGQMGGKQSDAHKAAVVGDTVGDPFKDTSGPSLNILIKLMSVVALVFAPVFVSVPSLLSYFGG